MELYNILAQELKKEINFLTDEGELKKWVVINKAQNFDEDLIGLLLDNAILKETFFVKVKEVLVFNQTKFLQFLEQKNYLNDSYTQYKNKLGLTLDGKYLKQQNKVALVWAFKDCVLEGGQTTEEQKRPEIFFNEILAQDEITQLFEPKVLTKADRIDITGEKPLQKIQRDDKNNITDSFIINGNNLLALHMLKPQFAGKVKLIYIDPPYNTGSDSFKYNDSFSHSTWLTFMKNRLDIAKEMLSEDGSIWINLDDNEAHYCKVLCDDIFGRENFVANVVWVKKNSPQNDAKYFSDNHDFILVFAKNKANWQINLPSRNEAHDKSYKNIDNDPRGEWAKSDLSVKTYSEAYDYAIENPTTGELHNPPKGRCWMTSQTRMSELIADNRVYFGENGKGKPTLKRFLSEVQQGIVPLTVWQNTEVGSTTEAKKELNNLTGANIFATPKPEKLLKRILEIGTKEGDLVLDFFGGSGTTGAVAHKMKRQYILIEQMEYTKDLPELRLKKVVGMMQKPVGELLERLVFDEGGISKAVQWQGGGSFIYMELKKHNETFMEQIEKAENTDTLLQIWTDMKAKSFLHYNLDLKKQEAHMTEFQALPLASQKQHLCEILDKNQLYVNLSSLHDADHACTEAEIQVTKDFYQKL